MVFHTSIYGLSIQLSHQIPGIAALAPPHNNTNITIRLGEFPSWFNEETVARRVRYASPETTDCGITKLTVWDLFETGHYQLRYADGTQFLIDKAATEIWADWPTSTLTLEDTATYLLGPVMGFALLLRGRISLHASAIAIDDRAVALVGPGGAGKSTTAAAFANLGFSVLAEDVVTISDHKSLFLVEPAYPSIRLWPSSVAALYGPHASLPPLTPNWDKCYLDLTQEQYKFHSKALPLAAVYFLGDRSDGPNLPSIDDVPMTRALLSLVANTYTTYLMDKEMRLREFNLFNRLLKSVWMRKVVPHIDPSRLNTLCQRIVADFKSLEVGGLQENTVHV